jgi:hypothetical protein
MLSGGSSSGCMLHLPARVFYTPTNVMDGEQSTVAGAPKQYAVVPVDVKNVYEENRGAARLNLKLGTTSSLPGCFTVGSHEAVRRSGGAQNPLCPRISPPHLAPSVAVDPRSWLVGSEKLVLSYKLQGQILYRIFDTKCYVVLGRTMCISGKSASWTKGSPSWVDYA